MNVILLSATIEKLPGLEVYTGSINEEKGCHAQGDSYDEVVESLLRVYQIKKMVQEKQKQQ